MSVQSLMESVSPGDYMSVLVALATIGVALLFSSRIVFNAFSKESDVFPEKPREDEAVACSTSRGSSRNLRTSRSNLQLDLSIIQKEEEIAVTVDKEKVLERKRIVSTLLSFLSGDDVRKLRRAQFQHREGDESFYSVANQDELVVNDDALGLFLSLSQLLECTLASTSKQTPRSLSSASFENDTETRPEEEEEEMDPLVLQLEGDVKLMGGNEDQEDEDGDFDDDEDNHKHFFATRGGDFTPKSSASAPQSQQRDGGFENHGEDEEDDAMSGARTQPSFSMLSASSMPLATRDVADARRMTWDSSTVLKSGSFGEGSSSPSVGRKDEPSTGHSSKSKRRRNRARKRSATTPSPRHVPGTDVSAPAYFLPPPPITVTTPKNLNYPQKPGIVQDQHRQAMYTPSLTSELPTPPPPPPGALWNPHSPPLAYYAASTAKPPGSNGSGGATVRIAPPPGLSGTSGSSLRFSPSAALPSGISPPPGLDPPVGGTGATSSTPAIAIRPATTNATNNIGGLRANAPPFNPLSVSPPHEFHFAAGSDKLPFGVDAATPSETRSRTSSVKSVEEMSSMVGSLTYQQPFFSSPEYRRTPTDDRYLADDEEDSLMYDEGEQRPSVDLSFLE